MVNYTAGALINVAIGDMGRNDLVSRWRGGGDKNAVAADVCASFSQLGRIISRRYLQDTTMKIIAYHGTNQGFDEFHEHYLGSSTGSSNCSGFYFSRSMEVAADYAHSCARRRVPDEEEMNKAIDELYELARKAERERDFDRAEELLKAGEKLSTDALQAPPVGAEVVVVELEIDDPLHVDMKGFFMSSSEIAEILDDAWEIGHDCVVFENIDDSPTLDLADDHFVVRYPSMIRIVDRFPAPELGKSFVPPSATEMDETPCF